MQQALATLEEHRWGFLLTLMLGQLAQAYGRAGNHQEAIRVLNRARAVMSESGERLAEAELYRIEGDLVLANGSANSKPAEACYRQAIELALKQEARSWELRAATSLARLWHDQGKAGAARDLLTPIYEWFTEGFGTPDLKDAKALLDELS